MIAVAFACGLGLGVVLGACLWSGALWIAHRAATSAQRRQVAAIRQEAISQKNRLDNVRRQLRDQFGNELTGEQEKIMEEELGTIFADRPHPQIPPK